jgi:hypothetical protein
VIYPLEQVAAQVSKTDQQLLYHLILEQQETNRLLRQLIENKQESPVQDKPERKSRKRRGAEL